MDTGRFAANLDDLEALADRPGFAARKAGSAAAGRLRGLGIACFLETSRGAPHEWAAIRFPADGSIALCLGTQSNGQGHETSFPQFAADHLGLPRERFRLVQADTDQVPYGNGHGGARSLHVGGTALVMAMDAMLEKARPIAARLLQAAPEALDARHPPPARRGGVPPAGGALPAALPRCRRRLRAEELPLRANTSLVLVAARRLGRPVAWVADYTEEFQAAVHGRDLRGRARLALDAEGRFLALQADMAADMGAYCSANGPACPTNSVSTAIGGVYAIPAIFLEVTGAFTNTAPVDAYRGAGKPEANYLTERLVEAPPGSSASTPWRCGGGT